MGGRRGTPGRKHANCLERLTQSIERLGAGRGCLARVRGTRVTLPELNHQVFHAVDEILPGYLPRTAGVKRIPDGACSCCLEYSRWVQRLKGLVELGLVNGS